jgi:predicted LPLAT superfamily acyltransferase
VQGSGQRQSSGKKKRGNRIGFWFFTAAVRVFGLRGAYGLLYIVCLHYLLFDRALVSSTLPYIRRRFPGCGLLEEQLHVYRLFVSQGKQLIDRYAAVHGRHPFEIQFKGFDQFTTLIRDSQKGAILLTSHEGNWQVAMTALGKMQKTVHVVRIPDQNPELEQRLYPDEGGGNVEIISPRQYLGGVVEILNALKKGHVVSMMGDRRYGSKALEVSFLGEKAWFPYSAFSLAAAVECPVVVLKILKVSTHRYALDMTNVLYPRYEGRKKKAGQLQPWVQEFATLTESSAQEHPYQCFLFSDVWKEESDFVSP